MRKERKHFTPEEKVAILRRHLVDRAPVSELCEELTTRNRMASWKRMHSTGDAAVAGRCKTPDSTVCGSIQLSPAAQRDRLRDAEGHARRASAEDSSRAGSEVGRGEGTAEESPPGGGVMDETDCSR